MGIQKELSSVTSKLVEARLSVTDMEEENVSGYYLQHMNVHTL
jgi:hypothetical protein